MATKRKHHEVILKVKYEALKELEKSRPNEDVANQFSIPGSTIATWKNNKEKIFEAFQNSCVVATFQSVVLFFWRKLISLLRPSITTILQH